jgi:hypothetical protein
MLRGGGVADERIFLNTAAQLLLQRKAILQKASRSFHSKLRERRPGQANPERSANSAVVLGLMSEFVTLCQRIERKRGPFRLIGFYHGVGSRQLTVNLCLLCFLKSFPAIAF